MIRSVEARLSLTYVSLSHLDLLPSTLRTLELVSHIWVLPDTVDHGWDFHEESVRTMSSGKAHKEAARSGYNS